MIDTTEQRARFRVIHRPKPHIPLALYLAMAYFVIIFMLMPLEIAGGEAGTLRSRIPLAFGYLMLLFALPALKRDTNIPRSISMTFLCFMVAFVLSGIYGPSGIVEAFRLFFAQAGLGITIFLTSRNYYMLRSFLSVVLLVSVANAIYGFIFIFPVIKGLANTLLGLGLPSGVAAGSEVRLVGFLDDPTYCGLMLLVGFFIGLERYMGKKRAQTSSYRVIIVLLGLGIVLTVSRTTWIATFVGLCVWYAIRRRVTWHFWLVVACIFAVTYYALEQLEGVIPTIGGRLDLSRSESRTWIWEAYFKLALQKPWGYGLGFVENLRKFATADYLARSTARPHNYFLIVWLEMGIQALIPLLLLIGLLFKRTWSTIHFYDSQFRENPGRLAVTLLVSLCVGLFSLGGMSQLLFLSVAMCLLSEVFVRGQLFHVSKCNPSKK